MAAPAPLVATYFGSAMTTGSGSSALSFPGVPGTQVPIPSGSFGAVFLEVCGMSTAGDYVYVFKNIGIKNPSGTVSIYGASTLTNLLGSPAADTALLTAATALTTGANTFGVNVTGPTVGTGSLVVTWAAWVTYKFYQLSPP